VVTGGIDTPEFAAIAAVVRESLGPRRTLIALDAPGARAWFSSRSPWLASMGGPPGAPTAYVCEEFVCRAPARTPDELRKVLGHQAAPA
jgi:uncharacterized protein YyaL (SSP411 family)